LTETSIPRVLARAPALALGVSLALAASLAVAAPLAAEAGGAPAKLSIDEAVAAALATDPGIISANLDWLAASAKAEAAKWKLYPSLTASAGAQYLGEQSATTMSLGATSFTLPAGMNHAFSLGLNLNYPVYNGNRTRESIAIAGLQAQAKDIGRESVKRALAFDVRRAYWEAVRMGHNRATLEKNLELMKQHSDLMTRQLGQGVATRADQLAALMRLEQATGDLGGARSAQKRACLSLASLTGADLASLALASASDGAPLPFELSSEPDEAALAAAEAAAGDIDEAALIAQALARRPETRSAELSWKLAQRSVQLSRAALYPTVAITGNANLADPSPRSIVQTEQFVASGSIGLLVTYDLGGVPAALGEVGALGLTVDKARSDLQRQRNAIVLDVELCIVNLEKALRDLASAKAMVEQARENLRVVQGRVQAGSAKDIDLSASEFDLLRTEFAVTNKRIDALIAQADLARATAAEDLR
jgi:outer membrane protein